MSISTIDLILKKYGKGAIFLLSQNEIKECHVIPTGSFILDDALGVGGFPRGRIVEIYGPESSGKTTLCQHVIAEAQQMGGRCAFVDVEHALDMNYAEVCGVNVDDLYISQPDTAEQALDIVEMLIRGNEFDVICLDSVAALAPRAELQGEIGDSHMALVARLMSQTMRKISGAIKDSNCLVIFTNQLRSKVGIIFGSSETTTGGNALKYYASIRVDLRRTKQIKDNDGTVGNIVKATIKKNKVAPPYKQVNFDIMYDEGISQTNELLKYGIDLGFISKGGSWFTIGEERIQGEANVRSHLKSDPELRKLVEDAVRKHLRLPLRRQV